MVHCPELEVFGDTTDSGDTLLDPSGTLAKNRRLIDSSAGVHAAADEEPELILENTPNDTPVAFTKVKGLFGMGRTGEFIFWSIFAAGTFVLCVFAAMVWHKWPVYAVPAGIATPIVLFKFFRAKNRWQGHRTFSQAVRETLE